MPTTRRSFLRAAAGAVGLAATGLPAQTRRPNFVVIYADDLGYAGLSCFGAPGINTPVLDRMAAEGVKLTDFYSCCPVCSASRYGLLTGRYQIRSGFADVMFPQATNGLRADEVTIAGALRAAGYATCCVGKWHQGHLPAHLPLRHGFDQWFGLPYSNDMDVAKRGDPPLPLYHNDTVVELRPDQSRLTERYTDYAIRFIREQRERPFFLYLPHAMPHRPIFASERFRGKSAAGLYGDVVEGLDWSTGEILKTLRELGLDEQTLVLFTSDNGPAGGSPKGSAGPLRGAKGTTWEGGVREPFVARWPGHIPPGGVHHHPAITLDLLPTLVGLAGAPLPQRVIDGVDAAGLLLRGEAPRRPEPLYYFHGGRLRAAREGQWKAHFQQPASGANAPKVDLPMLYDLVADVGEQTNLAAQHPETVTRLRERADAFLARVAREG